MLDAMEDSVSYAQWTVRVDPSLTQNAYKAIESGSADTCDCANCEHWLRIRDDVLPAEFQEFLRKVGIDASKEHDISEYEGGTIVHGRCLIDDDQWRSLSESKRWKAVYAYAVDAAETKWGWDRPVTGTLQD